MFNIFNTAGRYEVHNFDGRISTTGSRFVSLKDWQKHGYDTHSIIADSLFMATEHDDYGLKPESLAFKLGFQPIDMGKIGMRRRS